MNTMNQPVLVLNASYEPVNICKARRAMTMLIKGVASIEEDHDRYVHVDLQLPSVIRLNCYRRVPKRRHESSRKNIYMRDRYTCQYCGDTPPVLKLTLDHVVPRSRGGPSTWENLVTCCQSCNRKKADKSLEEANMTLLKVPRPMTLHTSRHILRNMGAEDEKWKKYLYY